MSSKAELSVSGIIPALLTPFSNQGDLNLKILGKYLRYLGDAGCNGYFVSGANGECFLQTVEERFKFTEAVIKELAGEKPVIFHVGAINPQEAYDLAEKAKKIKPAAISSVIPFYYGYNIKEISEYYKKLVKLSELPLIVYYAPENSGIKISNSEFIEHVISLPGVAGIKYTHSDLFQMQQLTTGCKGKVIKSYGGFDQMGVPFLSMGAQGLIGATFSLIPEVYVNIYKNIKEGNLNKAMQYQGVANRVSSKIRQFSRSAYKAFLAVRGIDTGKPRACWTEISKNDIAVLEKIYDEFQKDFESVS